jgi:hypothetical protein
MTLTAANYLQILIATFNGGQEFGEKAQDVLPA